ncbi:MAG: SDR family oxidoreductase [Pseudomonadota bacterium]
MSGKVALITGGSRGLGRSMALHLAEEGVGTVLTYLSQESAAQNVVREIEAKGARAVALRLNTGNIKEFEDFTNQVSESLNAVFEAEKIDFLINNAGAGAHATLAETTEEQFDTLVNVHVKGVLFLTQRMLPLMRDGGSIVNISSGLARFSLPGYGAYAAMKGAVEVMTRYFAKELAERAITVNTIAPGAIETDFGGGAVRDNADVNAFVASTTALGRAGLPDDIGGSVASLLTGKNGWITGQRIEVSGGMFL